METVLFNFQTSRVRRERRNGRDYYVAPLSLIVPGVLNGSQGPLYYPQEEVAADVHSWNDIPLTAYHPTHPVSNSPLSAAEPGVLDRQGIGFVSNDHFHEGKRRGEGWFDVEKMKRVDRRILEALEEGRPLELSTGLFTDNTVAPTGANFNGRPYSYVARNYRPDHVAILPDQVGACSKQDGCGVLVNTNKQHVATEEREKPSMFKLWRLLANSLSKITNGLSRDSGGKFAGEGDEDDEEDEDNESGDGALAAIAKKAKEKKDKTTGKRVAAVEAGSSEAISRAAEYKDSVTKNEDYPEKCPHCNTKQEIDPDDGTCNRCGKDVKPTNQPPHSAEGDVEELNRLKKEAKDLKANAGVGQPKCPESGKYQHTGSGTGKGEPHRAAIVGFKGEQKEEAETEEETTEEEVVATITRPLANQAREGTGMDRTQTINWLVANCSCWKEEKDRAILNSFGDKKLEDLHSLAVNAAKAEEVPVPAEEEEVAEEEEEEMKDSKGAPLFQKNKKPANNALQRLRSLPKEDQEAIQYAREIVRREQGILVNRLVSNVQDETRRKTMFAKLMTKSLPEIREMVELIPAPVANDFQSVSNANQQPDPLAYYLGASGSNVIVNKAAEDAARNDILPIPVINWAEESRLSRQQA